MSIHLPVVCVEADVLLRDGEAAGGAAPVRADADPAAEVRHAPPGLVIQNLHPEVSRLTRALKINGYLCRQESQFFNKYCENCR